MLKGLKEQYRQDAIYQVLLQKEYEITSQLQHPMVVSAFSFEEVEGLGPCIVMEWIDGITLKEWLAQGKHSLKQRRHVADMLMEALAYIQSRQTQHRDLKPSNIMLTHDGQHLKLIDFGLSDTNSHAILKAPAGTEGYMAPDGPSDIYSLGCILGELHLGWLSRMVARKCCAPLPYRYTDIATIKRDLHRCWLWPKRILLIICLVALATGFYQINRMHTQQSLQTLGDSLKVLKEENNAKMTIGQATADTLRLQIKQINEQRESEKAAKEIAEQRINDAKKQIDKQMTAYGIQQMFDTVTCRRNITIPFLRITDELIMATKEPELKEYIQERYRKPWIKRMNELPFD
jgi:serine/threonine protein kinase